MLQSTVSTQSKHILHNSATNITTNKITEKMASNIILEVTGDKGVTCLIRNFKCIVTVVESG